MQTLYIDVYFLVNFTVDLLSLYYASVFSKVPSSIKRIVLAALIASASAVCVVFLGDQKLLGVAISSAGLVLSIFIGSVKVSFKRRVKFMISFLIFEALFGGGVNFVWGILDEHLYDAIASESTPPVNRKMLLFALVVLVFLGVFKMIVSFFSSIVSEGSVNLEIEFFDKKISLEAFVDSGNLAVDPMDMQPIILIKKDMAKRFLPLNIVELKDPDSIENHIRRRIRLVPISRGGVTHVLTGIKADNVKIIDEKTSIPIAVTLAIDKEEGSYGGYYALIPSGVVGDAKK